MRPADVLAASPLEPQADRRAEVTRATSAPVRDRGRDRRAPSVDMSAYICGCTFPMGACALADARAGCVGTV